MLKVVDALLNRKSKSPIPEPLPTWLSFSNYFHEKVTLIRQEAARDEGSGCDIDIQVMRVMGVILIFKMKFLLLLRHSRTFA